VNENESRLKQNQKLHGSPRKSLKTQQMEGSRLTK